MNRSLSRRNFLRLAGVGAVSLASTQLPFIHRVLAQSTDVPDLEVHLRAVERDVALLPGNTTRVWMYQGELLHGDPQSLQTLENSYLGPVFRVQQGQHIRIHFTNELSESSIIHWHGLILPEAMDAHPSYAIPPGETYTYDFVVANRAGTYWYHPHPHGSTATQVYQGLAGLFIVEDQEEASLTLPGQDYDLPLVIQDRTFDDNNQLVYLSGGMMSRMMTQMMGFLGDNILVNGQIDFQLDVETRAYRLRLLNGSNFRTYKLGWSDDTPLTILATDGGLLEAPVVRPYVLLSPGERIELWVDFSAYAVGDELQLRTLPFTGIEMGGMMMGGMDHASTALPHGEETPILTVQVKSRSTETTALPAQLSVIERYQVSQAVNATAPRVFEIAMLNEAWTINGRTFDMMAVAEDEVVQADTLEVWEFVNVVNPPGNGMSGHAGHGMGNNQQMLTEDQMAHPMHIHGVQFQIIERVVDDAFRSGWETVYEGYVDEGWKDTVFLMPGERVKLLMRFGSERGLFVFHCHNLEHEDLGLMRNYRVD